MAPRIKTSERIVQNSLELFNQQGERSISTNHIAAPVQIQALHRHLISLVRQDLLGGNDAFLENPLVVIDVGQEHVQGLNPLNAAAFNYIPFAGLDTPGNNIERNQALGALLVPV